MFNQLLKLYRTHSKKTPLEDFTTELFVGLLNIEKEIKKSFISDFLDLPNADYYLRTQVKYELKNDTNCIVDFVIESDDLICFIENKVNSKEGKRQLERYGKVLDSYSKKTKLLYCTKYYDNKGYSNHHFKQIRWFEVAKFLNKFEDNSLVVEFINFLTTHKMAQKLTFSAQDFLTLENLQNILSLTNEHLDRVKPIFQETFKSPKKISDVRSVSQVLRHNRLIFMFSDIISENGWSEIKYGFQLGNPAIYVGIWIDKKNNAYTDFIKAIEPFKNKFIIKKIEIGISVELKKDISVYLNDDDADTDIANWFKDAFIEFGNLIKNTSNLNWKINVA